MREGVKASATSMCKMRRASMVPRGVVAQRVVPGAGMAGRVLLFSRVVVPVAVAAVAVVAWRATSTDGAASAGGSGAKGIPVVAAASR